MEKQFYRQCPQCGIDIRHTTKWAMNEADKLKRTCQSCGAKNRIQREGCAEHFKKYTTKGANSGENNPFYGKKHSEETKEKFKTRDTSYRQSQEYRKKISEATKGSNNPMYGVSVYQKWVEKYGQEKADELNEKYKEKKRQSSSGKNNPMYGRPAPQGSGNGWSGWYKNTFFRSLKELSYMLTLDAESKQWRSAECVKIPYKCNGVDRTYSPDFLVEGSLLVEIKPSRLRSSFLVRLKEEAAIEYCKNNNLNYEVIDPTPLPSDKIKDLRQSGTIRFTQRYEKMYMEKYN